jgi:hypothetical protein
MGNCHGRIEAMLLPYQRRLYILVMVLTVAAVAFGVFFVINALRRKDGKELTVSGLLDQVKLSSPERVAKQFILDVEGPTVEFHKWGPHDLDGRTDVGNRFLFGLAVTKKRPKLIRVTFAVRAREEEHDRIYCVIDNEVASITGHDLGSARLFAVIENRDGDGWIEKARERMKKGNNPFGLPGKMPGMPGVPKMPGNPAGP